MRWSVAFIFALLLLSGSSTYAAMTSTSYQINWDSLNNGGNDLSTSTSYTVQDTIAEPVAGRSTSTSYILDAGYRAAGGTDTVSLSVAAQMSTSTADSSYSALNVGAKTITVATPGAFTVGDRIAVIENRGFGEWVTIGKITSIVASTITLDQLSGDESLMSSSPSGGDDEVFRLSGSSLTFGSLSTSAQTTLVLDTSVQSTAASGYDVYLQAADVLKNPSNDVMTAVTDGTVSAGSEEYGAEVTGALAAGPVGDQGVTTTPRLIQSSVTVSAAASDRVATIFKIGITASTPAGAYTQSVYATLAPRY